MQRLPLICPGLLQRKRRNGEVQTTYTGVVLLEVGGLTEAGDVDRVKARVAGWPTTLAAFMGASGQSVKILVSGTLDDGTLPKEPEGIERFHRRLYDMSAQAYASVIGRPLQAKNAKPDNTFRWTYDATPFLNTTAAPIRILRRDVLRASDATGATDTDALEYGPGSAQPSSEASSLYRRRFALAVAKAKATQGGDVSQEAMLETAALESLRLNIPQEEAVRQATTNQLTQKMKQEEVRAIVESVYLENAPKAGKDRAHRMQETAFSLQEFLQQRYDLRFNELTNSVEWRRNHSASFAFQALDSRVMNTMIQEAHEIGLKVCDRDMKRFLGSTRVRDYNAARAYLRSVQGCWDGHTDYIGQIADRIPTSNSMWRKCFHTWFLGMVAQWESWEQLQGNNIVPLLVGPQGCGKSTFGQLLLPPELREVGYREFTDFTSKNDAERLLASSLLINLGELDQINENIQQEILRNLIQKTSIKGRRPYSSVVQSLPRFASFIATTDTTDVLTDSSSSRHFLVAEIRNGERIDTSQPLPYSKVYAQAVAELEAGEPCHYFPPELMAELEDYNSRYSNNRTEVLRFMDTFELATESDEKTLRMRLSDIADAIRRHTGFSYSDKAFNYLGRWLTGEARAQHVRKTVSNGSPIYLLRPRYK
ncbi:MAG: hypothetical protein IJQ38_05700 [Bacteroidaceae bacterium]|nr:hypothetical protein [Bacteroidaceae bacterium]